MSKTYTIETFKSYHHIKTFEKTYPNSRTPLMCINCWTNNKFKTMQEVYEYQRNKIIKCNNGEDMYLIMRKNGVIIEPKDYCVSTLGNYLTSRFKFIKLKDYGQQEEVQNP